MRSTQPKFRFGIQIGLGLLYLLSGLVKLNDPWGTAYKLEEYIELFATQFWGGFLFFKPHALSLSLLLCVAEVVLGLALMLRWRQRLTVLASTALILFFTLLTGYAWFSGNMQECGCFGDAIKLSAGQSFLKDLVLFFCTSLLWFSIPEDASSRRKDLLLVSLMALSFTIGYWSIAHLPFVDFLPFKIGADISLAKKPEESPKLIYIVSNGSMKKELDYLPADTSWKILESQVANPDKSTPKILNYSLVDAEGREYADSTLEGKVLLVIMQNVTEVASYSDVTVQMKKLWELCHEAEGKGYKSWTLTASSLVSMEDFRHEMRLTPSPLNADVTLLRMMLRAQCGVLLLENGVVTGKWHYNDIPVFSDIAKN